jgi:hypothetical protein
MKRKRREIFERPFEPVKCIALEGRRILLDFEEAKGGTYYIQVTKDGSKKKFINLTYVFVTRKKRGKYEENCSCIGN